MKSLFTGKNAVLPHFLMVSIKSLSLYMMISMSYYCIDIVQQLNAILMGI